MERKRKGESVGRQAVVESEKERESRRKEKWHGMRERKKIN